MKNLKLSIYLLLTVAIFTSCEKETTPLSEEPVMNLQGPKSIVEIVNSGIDLETYFNSLPKPENSGARPAYSQLTNPDLQFFYSPEEFPCSNLPTEDFEEARTSWGNISNPLDEYSNNGIFQPGEILPGISITSSTDTYNYADLILSGAGGAGNNLSKAIYANYYVEYLVIDFTTSDIMSVSMKVLSFYDSSPDTTIDVYGFSGLIGHIIVTASSAGVYLGIASDEPISRITIHSMNNGAEGVDDISFGICNDFDGDGVLNENDAHPNSDMSEYLNIGDCNLNVKNVLVKNGSTMMDQITDLTAQINSEYNGQNYKTLHSKFMTKLAQITYNWRTAKLITTTQRSQISSCAWGANIPYYNNED